MNKGAPIHKSLIIAVIVFIGWTDVLFASTLQTYSLNLIKLPSKEVVLEIQLHSGDRFYIDYIHSKDKTPVHDVFQIGTNGTLILLEEQYEWYGAGLAFHPRGKGQILFEKDGTRVLLNRTLDRFLLRVGRIANHTLTYQSQSIPLLSIANGGDLIEFTVEVRMEEENNGNK